MEAVVERLMTDDGDATNFMKELNDSQVKPFMQAFSAVASRTKNVEDRAKLEKILEKMVQSDKLGPGYKSELIKQLGGDRKFLEMLLPERPTDENMSLFKTACKNHKEIFVQMVNDKGNYAEHLGVLEVLYNAGVLVPALVRAQATSILMQLHAHIPHKPATPFQNCLIQCIADEPSRAEAIVREMPLDPKMRLAIARKLDLKQEGGADCMKALMCENVFDEQPENREMLKLVVQFLCNQGIEKAARWLAKCLQENSADSNIDVIRFISNEKLLADVLVALPKEKAESVANIMNNRAEEFSNDTLDKLANGIIHHEIVLNQEAHARLRPFLIDEDVTLPNNPMRDIELVKAFGEKYPHKLVELMNTNEDYCEAGFFQAAHGLLPNLLTDVNLSLDSLNAIVDAAISTQDPEILGAIVNHGNIERLKAMDLNRVIELLKVLPKDKNVRVVRSLLPDDVHRLGNQIGMIAAIHTQSFIDKMIMSPGYRHKDILIVYHREGQLTTLLNGVRLKHLNIFGTMIDEMGSGQLSNDHARVLLEVAGLPDVTPQQRVRMALQCGSLEERAFAAKPTIGEILLNYGQKNMTPHANVFTVLAQDPNFGQEVARMYLEMNGRDVSAQTRFRMAQEAYKYMTLEDKKKYPHFGLSATAPVKK
jgi:hypothetical protein